MTIRNPVTTVRQMCTDDVMHLYLADNLVTLYTRDNSECVRQRVDHSS